MLHAHDKTAIGNRTCKYSTNAIETFDNVVVSQEDAVLRLVRHDLVEVPLGESLDVMSNHALRTHLFSSFIRPPAAPQL